MRPNEIDDVGGDGREELTTWAVIDRDAGTVISWRRSASGALLIAKSALAVDGDRTQAPEIPDWEVDTEARYVVVETMIAPGLEQHIMIYGTEGLRFELNEETGFATIWQPEKV